MEILTQTNTNNTLVHILRRLNGTGTYTFSLSCTGRQYDTIHVPHGNSYVTAAHFTILSIAAALAGSIADSVPNSRRHTVAPLICNMCQKQAQHEICSLHYLLQRCSHTCKMRLHGVSSFLPSCKG